MQWKDEIYEVYSALGRAAGHSDDMELIEIVSPADFPTQEESAP